MSSLIVYKTFCNVFFSNSLHHVSFILATASLASVHFADTKNRKPEHISRTRDATVDTVDAVAPRGKSQPSKAVSLQGEPWYNEVVELRRQAHDYKVWNIIRIASS